jgi:hypothetical protein
MHSRFTVQKNLKQIDLASTDYFDCLEGLLILKLIRTGCNCDLWDGLGTRSRHLDVGLTHVCIVVCECVCILFSWPCTWITGVCSFCIAPSKSIQCLNPHTVPGQC